MQWAISPLVRPSRFRGKPGDPGVHLFSVTYRLAEATQTGVVEPCYPTNRYSGIRQSNGDRSLPAYLDQMYPPANAHKGLDGSGLGLVLLR